MDLLSSFFNFHQIKFWYWSSWLEITRSRTLWTAIFFNSVKSSRIQFSNPVNSMPRVTASVAAGWVKRTTRVERDDVSQERFCQGISRVAEKRYTPCKRANWYVSTATRFYKAIRYHVGIRNAFIPSKEYLR